MKKLFTLLMLCLLLGILPSCGNIKKLEVPTNVKLEGTVLTFDSVTNAEKYRLNILCKDDNSTMKRFVESGVDLNDLNISEGTYMISIQAINQSKNVESALSDEIEYKQIDLYAVKELSKDKLIDGKYIKWMGQTSYDSKTETNVIYYSASGFEVKVKKTEGDLNLSCVLTATNSSNNSKQPWIVIVLDGDVTNGIEMALTKDTNTINLVGEGGHVITDDNVHTITVYKRSESIDSHIALKGLETSGKFIDEITYKPHKMIVYAASSSTGYGNLGSSSNTKSTANSDCLKAFAFLTAQNLNSEINIVSASGWGIYASRWTTPNTLCMKDRYKMVDVFSTEVWDSKNYIPDVIVTNFGTNDASYINIASTDKEKQERNANFIKYYVDFLNELHTTYPNAKIVIIYGLMCESTIYSQHETIYNEALKTIPELTLLKVQGDQKGCNSHPSVSSHKQISDDLTAHIKKVMGW